MIPMVNRAIELLPIGDGWIRFERVVPETNGYRDYEITIVRDLFGEWAVVRCWGRVGGFHQRKTTCFPSRDETAKLAGRVARRRLSRGYEVASFE